MGERGQTARRAEIKASGDFHLTLAAISGNAITQRLMDELVARSSLVIALSGQSEHGDIVAANDLDEACRLMLRHIAHIEADLDLRERKSVGGMKEAFER